jgi:hypothetical protein
MWKKSNPEEQQESEVTETVVSEESEQTELPPAVKTENRWGNCDIEAVSVTLVDENNVEKYSFKTNDYMKIKIKYKVNKSVKKPCFGMAIYRNDGIECFGTNTLVDKIDIPKLSEEGIVEFCIINNCLLTGNYTLDIAIVAENDFHFMYDYRKSVLAFNIFGNPGETGINHIAHKWLIQ